MVPYQSERGGRSFGNRLIVSDSSAGNYWIMDAFQSLAPEWEVFERRLYEVLNPRCCFCFPKQTDMPLLLKALSTPILLAWVMF